MRSYSMTMNDDLAKYPVYALAITGEIIPMPHIKTTADYNHLTHHIHHFIHKGQYERNKKWYDERGIKQKLFYIPGWLHEQIHRQAVKNLTDTEFEQKFKISRWDLVFNRRHSKY
jgi:hypothetical protein